MYFQYDTSGRPLGLVYNGVRYFYLTNQMGDVIAIVDSNGNSVCEYVYDEWGYIWDIRIVNEENTAQVAVANANPLRYRGYYYDAETGYYYLQSRYYDPSICRFINADIPEIAQMSKDITAGTNIFAYCNNDPVNNNDPTGRVVGYVIIGAICGVIIGGVAGYTLSRILNIPKGKRWKYTVGGAIIGAFIGSCIGYAVGAAAGGSSGIVLWSGGGMKGAGGTAYNFALKNGLKTLEMTRKGKFLSAMNKVVTKLLGNTKAYKFMKPLWKAASKQFVLSAARGQKYVNVFISVSQFSNTSIFAKIEYQIVRSLGLKIIWHFVK